MTDAEKVELLERIIQNMNNGFISEGDDGYITLDGCVHGLSREETDYLFTINEKE